MKKQISENSLRLLELRGDKIDILKTQLSLNEQRKRVIEDETLDPEFKYKTIGGVDASLKISDLQLKICETEIQNLVTILDDQIFKTEERIKERFSEILMKFNELKVNITNKYTKTFEKFKNIEDSILDCKKEIQSFHQNKNE